VLNLCLWMRQSGLAEFDLEFVPSGSDGAREADRALGWVDFTLYPHLDREEMPDTSLANTERWASGISASTYAIDDVMQLMMNRSSK
jgi:dipeptidase E